MPGDAVGRLKRLGKPYVPDTRRSYIEDQYPLWTRHNRPRASDMSRMRNEAARFEYRPLVSILLPVYNPEKAWLERALDSVLGQPYQNWELCVCDDGSTKEHVKEVLARYERLDGRVKVRYLERDAGISGASNAALSVATGEFVGLLGQHDELSPDALFEVVRLLQERPEADLIYSDEDEVDENGRRFAPHFKPGWSPDLLMSTDYVLRLGVYRSTLLNEIGGFKDDPEIDQGYDTALRFTEKTDEICRIPKVLYHRRVRAASGTPPVDTGRCARDRARRPIIAALARRGIEGSVEDGLVPGSFRARMEIKGEPKVSIIIPTRDNSSLLRKCVESIERLTTYRNYEILIVDNNSVDPETVKFLTSTLHQVIRFGGDFNYSKINNFAASHAEGEYVLLLNDDTEVISGEWMEAMLEHAQRPEVGAVGAKLLYPDGRIQHAGVLVGIGGPWNLGLTAHCYRYYPGNSPGHAGGIATSRNYSVVTAACMMLRRVVFEEVRGFDEDNLPIAFNDVDLCLRVRERGYLVVYTPYAELYHHEAASRGYGGDPAEIEYLRQRWGTTLASDPYYNPNFSTGGGDFNLRADMLRPKILQTKKPQKDDQSKNYLTMSSDELQKYLVSQRKEARNSRRTTLKPKQEPVL